LLPNPLIVTPETSLLQFIRRVLDSNQTTAVVLQGEQMVGIVSVHDIFRKILPPYVGHMLANAIREGFFEERFEKFASIAVSEIMTRRVQSLAPGDEVIKAVALFVRSNYKTIPVLEGGRFVGSVTRRSILHRVSEGDG